MIYLILLIMVALMPTLILVFVCTGYSNPLYCKLFNPEDVKLWNSVIEHANTAVFKERYEIYDIYDVTVDDRKYEIWVGPGNDVFGFYDDQCVLNSVFTYYCCKFKEALNGNKKHK